MKNIHSKLPFKYYVGILNGPDIRKLLASERFELYLSPLEKEAFVNLRLVIQNFLGNHRSDDYKDIVHNMLMSFDRMNINMSPKIHYLQQHLDFFPDNLGKVSDEHGERVHQQMKKIEERFQGKPLENMLAEFVWYSFEEHEAEVADTRRMLQAGRSHHELRSFRLGLME